MAVVLLQLTMVAAENENTRVASCVIKGMVTDQLTGEALSGVVVAVDGSRSTYTDFDGKFQINDVTGGDHVITTNYISYQSKQQTVTLDPSSENNLKIELTY